MLGKSIAVTTIAVTDLKRARSFYEDKLGFPKPEGVSQAAMYQLGGGTGILLYERKGRPPVADHTLVSFEVEDIAKEMKELRSKGIKFEEYDFPGLKTVDGVADMDGEKAAWFKDPDGNILAVGERVWERNRQPQMTGHASR